MQKRLKRVVSCPEVTGALDRVNLPDRSAVYLVASVAKALGHHLDEMAQSRSTIRKSRIAIRQQVSLEDIIIIIT